MALILPSDCCLFSAVQALLSCRHKTPSTCLRLLETCNSIVYYPENLTNSFEARCLLSTHLDEHVRKRCSHAPTQWTETVPHSILRSARARANEENSNGVCGLKESWRWGQKCSGCCDSSGQMFPSTLLFYDWVVCAKGSVGTRVQWQAFTQG